MRKPLTRKHIHIALPSQVINIDPQNVKALFRRGKSRLSLGRTEEAQQDLEAAAKMWVTGRRAGITGGTWFASGLRRWGSGCVLGENRLRCQR